MGFKDALLGCVEHGTRGVGAGRIRDAVPVWNPTGDVQFPIVASRLMVEISGTTAKIVHVEKSRIQQQLEASLVAQTGTAIGRVLNAIEPDRQCLLDLMPAWTRLLKLYGIPPSGQSRTSLRRDWFWQEVHHEIVMALCYCETDSAVAKWHVADMTIRGEAAEAAIHAERTLCDYVNSPDGQETADMLRRHIALYKAFAEGQ